MKNNMDELRGIWRGKRIDNGEWVSGYLIRPKFNDKVAYIGYLFATGDHDRDVAEVIPLTLGEYTGLTDKNDVKIFEGDIVEYDNKLFKLVYVEGFATFNLRSTDNMRCAPHITTNSAIQMKVIGNIHDNPELLEV